MVDGSVRNAEQRISDDGDIVVFESTSQLDDGTEFTSVVVHDRTVGDVRRMPESRADATSPVPTFNPSVSGNGCIVTYSTFAAAVTETPDPDDAADEQTAADTDDQTNAQSDDDPDGAGDAAGSDQSAESSVPTATTADDEAARQTEPVVVMPAVSELRAVDRCSAPELTTSVLVASEPVDAPLPAAAVSSDGVFVAYSNGDAIVRMQGTVAGYTLTSVFDTTPVPAPDVVTGPGLDITADGSVVVFEAGVDETPDDSTDPVALGLHAWTAGVGPTPPSVRPVASLATRPSVSADGGAIAFEAQVGSDAAFSGVVLQLVTAEGGVANLSIDPQGSMPDVSSDGRHVVHNTPNGVAMVSSVSDAAMPFAGVEVTDLGAPVGESPALGAAASGPAVAALGDAVAVDPAGVAGISPSIAVRTVPASIVLDATAYDLGNGDVGDTISTPITVTNQGPATLVLGPDAITVDAPFAVAENGCVVPVGPRSSCVIEVALTIESLDDVIGSISVAPPNAPSVSADLAALTVAPTTESATTVTTTPPNTTPIAVPTTVRTTTPFTTNTIRVTTPITQPATTSAPIIEIDLDPIFEPATFDFAATIIDAGSRTASLEIINPSSSTEVLASVEFQDPASGLTVGGTDCVELGVGSRCTVDLVFAPSAEGDLTDQLVATFESGSRATATVTGVGAPPPTLSIIPDVATVGQVVTVQGAGYPAGSTVELSFGDGVVDRDVVVNDVGVFNVPFVVLPNTQPGPLIAAVAGQEDAFGDTTAEMLVTKTSSGTSPMVLGSLGANVGR